MAWYLYRISYALSLYLCLRGSRYRRPRRGEYSKTLQATSSERHNACLKQLLELGAEVNAQGRNFGNRHRRLRIRLGWVVVGWFVEPGEEMLNDLVPYRQPTICLGPTFLVPSHCNDLKVKKDNLLCLAFQQRCQRRIYLLGSNLKIPLTATWTSDLTSGELATRTLVPDSLRLSRDSLSAHMFSTTKLTG